MSTGDEELDARIRRAAAAAPPVPPEQFALIAGLMRRAGKEPAPATHTVADHGPAAHRRAA